ncbi:peroxide stress protein YaaA [Profundibacterium mesophilum]|uniref:UPF0246 protein PMES_01134 n=1 Tax=Profundibacterium mesophilum KAUST100406-0324 TaxID=1037889 RepID=A0A921NZI8_9RHOB|nr:peroxide stress protein YaaA [Profundibacterium mesophilum]KAF0676403.1 hypothetical protein PMES_01134 [Profundibacterium mesophilum KAUST100406-0324]
MLTVISPAKKLDWDVTRDAAATPQFQGEANILADHVRALPLADLKALMGLSDTLAKLTRDRFRDMAPAPDADNSRPAIRVFAGDTYQGLDARSLDDDALRHAQEHLRILSGLYGLLRPLDAVQAYRLEMGSRLATERGRTLYAFWGSRLSEALNAAARETGSRYLLNCASKEYFGAVARDVLEPRVITPAFLERKEDGSARMVSFHAKRARGAMARFVAERRIRDPEALEEFDSGGYAFAPEMSEPGAPVFVRPAAAGAA